MKEILETSEVWSKHPDFYKYEVLDPDGWDRKNFEYSWNIEKISKEEFKNRLRWSTVVPRQINTS